MKSTPNIPELNASYGSLDDLVSSQPEFLPYVEQLDSLYPEYSDEDIMQIIQSDGVSDLSLNRPQRNMNPGNVKIGGIGDQYARTNADGTFNVRVTKPTKKGEFAYINVSAPGIEGSKKAFRVERMPTPVVRHFAPRLLKYHFINPHSGC